jgi:hypothetical protein
MNASRLPVALAAGLMMLLACLPAAAQNAPGGKNALTIYGGYAWGGSFDQTGSSAATVDLASGGAGALSIDWAYDAARTVQLFASTQRSELPLAPGSVAAGSPTTVPLNITYLHLGGTNFFEGNAGQGAYVAGGLGATFMSPSLDGLSSEVRPSMSVALGYEQPLAPSLALRAELRGYATLINSNGGFFCSGGCVVALKGDALLQGEALLGLSLRF